MLTAILLDPTLSPPPADSLGKIRLETIRDVRKLGDRLTAAPGSPDLLVIGDAIPRPIDVAQTAQKLVEDLGVIILCRAEVLERLRSAVRFSPFLGNVECLEATPLERCRPVLESAAEATRRRRQHRAWLKAAEQSLALPDTARRPTIVLDLFLRHAPIGVLVLSADGVVVTANLLASELLGSPGKHFAGERLTEVLPAFPRDKIELLLDSALPPGAVRRTICSGSRAGGRTQHLSLSLVSTPTGGSEPPLRLLMLEDVTDRVHSEVELREAHDELRGANVRRDRFANDPSHDLETPLRTVVTSLRLLEERCAAGLDAAGRMFLRDAVRAAAQAAERVELSRDDSRADREPHSIESVDRAASGKRT